MTHEIIFSGRDRLLHAQGEPGIISSRCPERLLQYVSHYASAAQWLYCATLPEPHDEVVWSDWYLCRILRRENWTVIASVSQATNLNIGVVCPAFAVVAREYLNPSSGQPVREALLVVRGTASMTDWKINMNDNTAQFVYKSGVNGSVDIPGYAHEGMLEGARAILKLYGVSKLIHRLLLEGFNVKTVGHSLGASTALFLAAELNNSLVQIRKDIHTPGLPARQSKFIVYIYSSIVVYKYIYIYRVICNFRVM